MVSGVLFFKRKNDFFEKRWGGFAAARMMKNKNHNSKPNDPLPAERPFVEPSGDSEVLLKNEDTYVAAFKTKPGKKRSAFKTLLTLYKGNYTRLIVSVLCFVIKTAPVSFYSLAVANVINALIYSEGVAMYLSVAINLGIVLLGYLLNLPLDVIYARFTSKAIRSVEANLRSSLIRKLHMLSIGFFKHIQSGRLQSKIMRDVEAITDLSHQLLSNIMSIAMSFIVALSVTVTRSPIVLLVFIILVPVDLLLIRFFRGRLVENNKKFRQEIENTSASVIESMELMPVTKAHGLEDTQVKKMDEQFERVAKDGYKLDRTNAFFGRCMWFVSMSMQVVCLIFNIILAQNGYILIGDISLYQTYFTSIVNSINAIINLLPILSKGMESVNSVGDILLAEDIEDNYHKLVPPKLEGEVNFEDVSFRYDDGDRNVLNNFNLKVKAGETIAFVGASGCGKTTAINLVIGFGKVTSGRVLIDGMNINNFNLHEYRSQLAVVPQTPILFSGTIRDNITYGNENISDEDLNKAIDKANLKEFVDSLPEGANTVIGEHGGTLSGGQRQRIAIARALIRNPSIVILDEATSALDTVSERKIQTAINNVAKGRTTFIVAHRLSTIRNADRIVVFDKGKVAEIGTFDELMALGGMFYKLQTMQDE